MHQALLVLFIENIKADGIFIIKYAVFIFKVARQPFLLFVGIVHFQTIRDSFQFINNAPTILLNDILH